jgi:hypothetical protein
MAPNAAIDLCAVEDAKAWLDITGDKDDDLLQSLVTNVSQRILNNLNRPTLVVSTYAERYDGSDTPQQALRNFPIVSVSSLSVNGKAVVQSPDGVLPGFTFDQYALKLVDTPIFPSFPGSAGGAFFCRGFQNIAVTYQAGYSAIPFDIVEAARQWVAYLYRQRSRIGQTSKHLSTGETVSFSQKEMPDFVAQTLQQYKRLIPV